MPGHAATSPRYANAPDLSGLDAEQASALEQIAGEAMIGFCLRRAELRGRYRQSAAASRYAAETIAEIDRVRRLEAMARRFLAAAHARSHAAERERCLAVRAVEYFAGAAVRAPGAMTVARPPVQRRSVSLPATAETLQGCAREP